MGGGISGLAAAHYFNKAGHRATLVEQSGRLGGVIATDHLHGCTLEGGPDSFLSAKPAAAELIRNLGLADQLIGSRDSERATFILREGRLRPLPEGMMMMVPTRVMPVLRSSLLSWGTRFRMGVEYFRRPRHFEERSVAQFLRDHYGQEAVDYLGEPLLAGVYGGDPERLSANSVLPRFVEMERRYGSLSRAVLKQRAAAKQTGARPLFSTLRDGLGGLVDALSTSANVVYGRAECLERTPEGFRVRVDGHWISARAVLMATPAWQSAELVRTLNGPLADALAAVAYTSSLTISLGYRRQDIPLLKGFGFLVPKTERRKIKACTFVHNKFDGRVPPEYAVLRCFMTGDALQRSDEEVVRMAREELASIADVRAEPLFRTLHRWPRSMAQYEVGHASRVQEIESLAAQIPGLYLAGNAFQGIGIPDCIQLAQARAQATISARLKR